MNEDLGEVNEDLDEVNEDLGEVGSTPDVLRGTDLQAPTLRWWHRANRVLLVAGCVILADPIVFLVAVLAREQRFLIHRPGLLIFTPIATFVWAMFAVSRGQRAKTPGRILSWTVLAAALNAGSIAGAASVAEGAGLAGFIVGAIAVLVTIPLSLPVGLIIGILLWAMNDWERRLRRSPTQDAQVRWIGAASFWLALVGCIGEALVSACAESTGMYPRRDVIGAFAWGPHLALFGSAALAVYGAYRLRGLRTFVDRVRSGKVQGLVARPASEGDEALTLGVPDVKLVQRDGEGAFRTAESALGGLSLRNVRMRAWGLIMLAVVTTSLAVFSVNRATHGPFAVEYRSLLQERSSSPFDSTPP